MTVFDNCRICLEVIKHEPIKITRIILKFIEQGLNLKYITKKYEPSNVKQNLCAGCFNKLSELQDFYEQCREADDYWQQQFACDKQKQLENCMKAIVDEEETEVVEEGNELVINEYQVPETVEAAANPCVKSNSSSSSEQSSAISVVTTEVEGTVDTLTVHIEDLTRDAEPASTADEGQNENIESCGQIKQWSPHNSVEEVEEEEEDTICVFVYFSSKNLQDFTFESDPVKICTNLCKFASKRTHLICVIEKRNSECQQNEENPEIIFQYDNVDLTQSEVPSSTMMEMENHGQRECYDFEEVEDSCDALIQDTIEDVLGDESHESHDQDPDQNQQEYEDQEMVENTYYLTTTTDENGKVKKTYNCQHCDRSFDRVYDIESHYNIHTDIKPYVCDVCGKSFRQKNILTTHQALHFGKKIDCPECGKKFARRSQLILHFRMHRNEKPFVCDIDGCDAAFRQRQHLVDHTFIHTGEKNFQCMSCHKSFHTRKRLQDHMYKVHSSYRYGCNMCEKAFLKPHMLKNHILNAHNCEVTDVSHLKISIDQLKPSKKSKLSI